MEKTSQHIIDEIEAILNEDETEPLPPEDAPVRGVPTLHALPEEFDAAVDISMSLREAPLAEEARLTSSLTSTLIDVPYQRPAPNDIEDFVHHVRLPAIPEVAFPVASPSDIPEVPSLLRRQTTFWICRDCHEVNDTMGII